ncbi:putative quinol monooxygenase [Bacillus sp. V5-8f]|uniref:putative quinol monooxygenase n=1 Tax=Bacillus sp. V5-8f TaxID=2053044 RepID=UPI000C772ABF|nr:putative quinol monooxygenase [Bacillus sp. V5-8f]PLT34472.1 antibiotic biosynthesis monooxygenase [Bacillus sp. V5-8f]
MIIIHAFLKVDSNKRQEFLDIAKEVTALSQAEEGNISYQFYEDPRQPNSFVFLEKWKDGAAIKEHEDTAHFKQFSKEVPNVLSEPIKVELFEASAIN